MEEEVSFYEYELVEANNDRVEMSKIKSLVSAFVVTFLSSDIESFIGGQVGRCTSEL